MGDYSLGGYGQMAADRVRMDAYAAALEQAVRPGSVVLDIGTGAGMMALLACRLGARKVYAVEPADVVHTAREIARANGMGDRIEFIQGLSTRVDLPERADVVVSDLRGALPLFGRHIPSIVDARVRLLAEGGVLIPRRDTLRGAVVAADERHGEIVGPWEEGARGFDLSIARRAAVNAWTRAKIRPEHLLSEPATWAVLEYSTIRDPDVRGPMEWTAGRGGTAHGFAMWFDADVAEGVGYTSGPHGPKTVYGTAFFPWPRAVELAEGDRVTVELQARLVGDEYVWLWDTRIQPATDGTVEFRQSTFFAEPLSPARLRARSHTHRPRLGEDGRIDRLALERMEGAATLEEIARELAATFPARFGSWEEALTHAGRLAEKYGE
ncbi:MAG TPA: 50S ribosomal protein L11 methyltransferase [Longimicrobium sp.]|nr:50S ribosomal protein L11 methyltransferase [Longimicrobium sp.]